MDSNYSFNISTPDMFDNPVNLLSKQSFTWHGVAIGWRRDLGPYVISLDSTYSRIVGITLILSSKTILLASLYAPTCGLDEVFFECISNLTHFLNINSTADCLVIIGADLSISNRASSRRQQVWNDFCIELELVCHYPPLPSFHHHNGVSESYCFVSSKKQQINNICQYCTLDEPLKLSSHDLILTETLVTMENAEITSKFESTYQNFNRQKITMGS